MDSIGRRERGVVQNESLGATVVAACEPTQLVLLSGYWKREVIH